MSGRMMLYKSPAWRRGESVVGGALGIGIGLAARYLFHLPPMLALLGVLVGFMLALLGSGWLAGHSGAPRLPAVEVTQRYWKEITAEPVWRIVLEWTVGFPLLLSGIMLIVAGPDYFLQPDGQIMTAVMASVGFFAGVRRAVQARRMAGAPLSAEAVSHWQSLRRNLPRYYAGLILGLVLGVGVGLQLHGVWRIVAVLGGFMLGSLALRLRRDMPLIGPSQSPGLVRTLLSAELLWGVPMALFFPTVALMLPHGMVHLIRTLLVGGIAGLSGGVFFGFFVWIISLILTRTGSSRAG